MEKDALQKRCAAVLIILWVMLAIGCGDDGDSDNNSKKTALFNGSWNLYEDFTDCVNYEQNVINIEINQNAGNASLTFIDADLTFNCQVDETALRCSAKEFSLADGGFLKVSDLILEYQDKYLETGVDTLWTPYLFGGVNFIAYEANHANPCKGSSTLSSVPLTETVTDEGQQGSLRINNISDTTYGLINIAPCDRTITENDQNWGDNLLGGQTTLSPSQYIQITLDSAGCHDFRACPNATVDEAESGCVFQPGIRIVGEGITVLNLDPVSW